jgi:hypothetical protein
MLSQRERSVLTSRGFLVALALLLANDFVFKAYAANWITGKLSDFAGLFVFAVFWTAIAPRHRLAIHLATAAAFALWKSPLSDPVISMWNADGMWPVQRVVDYSDWGALIVLPASYRYTSAAGTTLLLPVASFARSFVRALVSAVCLFAMVATSRAPRQYHVVDWDEDGTSHSSFEGELQLVLKDLVVSYGPTRLAPLLVIRNTGVDTVILRRANLASGRDSYRADLRAGGPVERLMVRPGVVDSVRLAWEVPTHGELVEPTSVWLTLDVGGRTRIIRAMLSRDEYEAHRDRRRARTARLAGATFLSGLLAALIVRRKREESLGSVT